MRTAQKGDTIRVHFTGTLEDGTRFADSRNEEPFTFTIGEGTLISGFEQSTIGMAAGETKTIRLEPEQAFGDVRPELVQKVPRSAIPPEIQLDPGVVLQVNSPTGQPMPVVVTEITDEEVTLDANPPLAGKVLNFDIELVAFV